MSHITRKGGMDPYHAANKGIDRTLGARIDRVLGNTLYRGGVGAGKDNPASDA